MAYDYEITLTDIELASGTTTIELLTFDVTESNAQVNDLVATDFTITDSSDSAVAHTLAQGTGNAWVVTITTPVANTERLSVQIITDDPTAKKSEKYLIDFLQTVSGAAVEFDFVLPAESGDFSFDFDLHNVSTFNAEGFTSGDELDVRDTKPTNADSSIALKGGKYYLTYFSGDTITLEVDVKDGSGYADGNYELSIKGSEVIP